MNALLVGVFVLAALYFTYKALQGSDGEVALLAAILWVVVWGASRAIYYPETDTVRASEPLAALGFFGAVVAVVLALADWLGEARNQL